jgi:hypothetical protein
MRAGTASKVSSHSRSPGAAVKRVGFGSLGSSDATGFIDVFKGESFPVGWLNLFRIGSGKVRLEGKVLKNFAG